MNLTMFYISSQYKEINRFIQCICMKKNELLTFVRNVGLDARPERLVEVGKNGLETTWVSNRRKTRVPIDGNSWACICEFNRI